MDIVSPGDAVLGLVKNASDRLIIAAPYMKRSAIRRMINVIPDTVSDLTCITRWLPEDIASGVCDLEIVDDVLSVQGGQLLVHPHLHAKYYSNGKETLVGSANLTSRGLGWHTPANIELLVALPSEFPGLENWESVLLNSAIQVTEKLCHQISHQADQFKRTGPIGHSPEVEEAGTPVSFVLWVPQCPVPEHLWTVYCGGGSDTMVSSAFNAAQDDLKALSPPQGLSEEMFTAYIAGILRQMPLIAEIEKLSAAGLTDTGAQDFLSERLGRQNEGIEGCVQIWRTVKLWLIYFFPKIYRLETGQEVLVRGREISRR